MRPSLERIILSGRVVGVLTDHAVDSTNATIYTFSSKLLGTPANGKVNVVTVQGGNGGGTSADIATVTVVGNSAPRVIQLLTDGTSNRCAAMYSIVDSVNSSGNIVVTFGAGQTRCGISVFALYGARSAAAFLTNSVTIASASNTATSTLTIPPRGFAIAAVQGVFAADQTATWTNYNENVDEVIESLGVTQHVASLNGWGSVPATVTFSGNVSANSPFVHAAWSP